MLFRSLARVSTAKPAFDDNFPYATKRLAACHRAGGALKRGAVERLSSLLAANPGLACFIVEDSKGGG